MSIVNGSAQCAQRILTGRGPGKVRIVRHADGSADIYIEHPDRPDRLLGVMCRDCTSAMLRNVPSKRVNPDHN